MSDRRAKIHMDGWSGRTSFEVVVVGETSKRFRIKTIDSKAVRLAGRNRWLLPGATALVPKRSVEFLDKSESDG